MKLRVLSALVFLSILFSACQFATSLPGQTGVKAANFDYIFQPPAEPVSVSVALDDTRAVEAVIPVGGGSIRTAGADGTQYQLDIPGDALLAETKIRMTPSGVTGLPFGGERTYAVQFEPEGLFLNNFATLTITPAEEIPLKEQLFFGYQSSGKDLIFAPPVVDSREIKIRLLHFSGYGVTKGLLADPESVRQRLGGDAERRLQSEIAEQLGHERQNQLLGQESSTDLESVMKDLFDRYEKEVVAPRVAAAGESCAAGRLALQTVLGLERQKQLLGIADDGGLSQFGDLMNTVSRVCLKEEYELCAEDHIIHRMIPVWLGFERQFQLLGIAGEGERPAVLKEAEDLVKKCLTFELRFESQANFDAGGGEGFDSTVTAKIPLHFDPESIQISGSSALVNDSFEFKVEDCKVVSNRGGSTFQTLNLVYIADTHSASDSLGYVRDFKLTYFPERTTETFSVTCPDSGTYTSPPSGLWWSAYLVLHADELSTGGGADPGAGPAMPDLSGMMESAQSGFNFPMLPVPQVSPGDGFVLQDWEVSGGEYFAKKEWIKENGELGLVESGTLKLYHRPGQ